MTINRAAYEGGTGYTTHPHEIKVRNVSVGSLSSLLAIPIRISGAHGITIKNVTIGGSTVAAFYHHAGDLGYEFAHAAIRPLRHQRIVVRNFLVLDANNGWGAWIDCRADNVAIAQAAGYSPSLETVQRADITLENFRTYSDGSVTVAAGFRVQQVIGAILRNCYAYGHKQGILVEEGGDEVTVHGGTVHGNREDGLYANHGIDLPQILTVDGLLHIKTTHPGAQPPTFECLGPVTRQFAIAGLARRPKRRHGVFGPIAPSPGLAWSITMSKRAELVIHSARAATTTS